MLQRHAVQEGGHLLLSAPHAITCCRMLKVLQPAPQLDIFVMLGMQLQLSRIQDGQLSSSYAV